MMGYGFGYGFPVFWMMLIPTVFIIVIIFALYKLLGFSSWNKPYRPGSGNALNLLDERYAKGEIDDEEYQRKKQLLLKSQQKDG